MDPFANSWLKHLLENPSHFKSHISAKPVKRNGLRSIVTRPVITPWDIDYQRHCCMQAFTVPGYRRVSAQYDSDCWLHFNEMLENWLSLQCSWVGYGFSTNKDIKDSNKPAPWGKLQSDRYRIITRLVWLVNFLCVVRLKCDFENRINFRAPVLIVVNHYCLMAILVSDRIKRIHLKDNTTHLD